MDALNEIKRWRQELHQIPELGLQEFKTSKYLKDELTKMDTNQFQSWIQGFLFILIIIKIKPWLFVVIWMH